MSSKEYLLLNMIFAALFFGLFMSAFILDSETTFSCQVLARTGIECQSCGLSRDFMAFSHFNFQAPVNANSIYVFLWFLTQLLIRVMGIIMPSRLRTKLIPYDLIFALVSGLFVFLPFWL